MSRRFALSILAVAVAAPMLLATPAHAATSRHAAALAPGALCKKVTPAEVSKALGLKATKVSTTINGSVTVCWYTVGGLSHAVYVRSQTGTTTSAFNAEKKLAKQYGENPVTDKHFGSYVAFSTKTGSATYGYVYAVTILKKSTQLDIGASKSSLTKVEGLAKKVLPIL